MRWPDWLAAGVGVAYVGASVGYALAGKPGLSLAYAAYALANVGLVWASVEG